MKEIMIKCNVGSNERSVRFVLGALMSTAVFWAPQKWQKFALGGLGFSQIAIAASRYSPLYHLLGIRRCQPAYRAFPHLLRRL